MAAKIVVDDFDVSYKFVNDLFVIITEFNDSSTKLIKKNNVHKKAYTNDLDQYGWKIYRPLVHRNKASPNCNCKNTVQIIFTAE